MGYDLAELEIKKHNLQGSKKEKGGEVNKNVTNIQIVEKTNKNKNQIILPSKRNIFKVEYVFVFIMTFLYLLIPFTLLQLLLLLFLFFNFFIFFYHIICLFYFFFHGCSSSFDFIFLSLMRSSDIMVLIVMNNINNLN